MGALYYVSSQEGGLEMLTVAEGGKWPKTD